MLLAARCRVCTRAAEPSPELSRGYYFHERLLNHAPKTQNHQREYFLAPCIARIASHTISHLQFFISVFIDNTETSTFMQLYRIRRFFDRTKAAGVRIRTTGAHLHAETAEELAYTLPTPAQLKCSGS